MLHEYAFFVSLITGPALILAATDTRSTVAVSVYGAAVAGLFGTSALYHRVTWTEHVRRWMRRLDHSMIFMLIAGTYTACMLLALSGTLSIVVLSIVWGGAIAGIVLQLAWVDAPRWLVVPIYIVLGWAGIIALPAIAETAGATPLVLILAGGVLYSVGALIYARRSPDPAPAVFGYHEIFHTFVIVAAVAHYAAIAFFLLPAAQA